MAPVKPRRRTARARVARSQSQLGKYAPPSPTHETQPADESPDEPANAEEDEFGFGLGFKLSKKDKRTVKHNTLLNRVRDSGISKETKTRKRRRPNKKLNTDIGGLEDALPDVEDEWEGIEEDESIPKRRPKSDGKIEMKSLKHKPGAMKKKLEMEGRERERFGKNLAGLMGTSGEAAKENRWAALRMFIGGTMEKDKAFEGN